MTDTPSFVTTCTEDEEGNVILDIPEELLEAMGWGEGTILDISALPGRLILHEVPPESDSSGGGTDS
jgi:hypothetical protein